MCQSYANIEFVYKKKELPARLPHDKHAGEYTLAFSDDVLSLILYPGAMEMSMYILLTDSHLLSTNNSQNNSIDT